MGVSKKSKSKSKSEEEQPKKKPVSKAAAEAEEGALLFRKRVPLARKANELENHLRKCFYHLRSIPQLDDEDKQEEPNLKWFAEQLLKPFVLKSKGNGVKLFAGCCLVETLRIFAPNAPFGNFEVKVVLEFLIDRLRGLQLSPDSEGYQCSLYILRQLFEWRSICILVNCRNDPGDLSTTEDIIVSFVDAMFDIMVPDRSERVERLAENLIVVLFSEVSMFSPRILDTILSKLLPEYSQENPNVYNLARQVLKQMSDRLREPISTLLISVISGVSPKQLQGSSSQRKATKTKARTPNSDSDKSDSDNDNLDSDVDSDAGSACLVGADRHVATEITENLYEIVFQLAIIEPDLLLTVLPHLANQLEVDDIEVREKAVTLFCRIFCEVKTENFLNHNEKLFATLLRRVFDIDAGIRLALIRFAGYILTDSPFLSPKEDEAIANDSNEAYPVNIAASKETILGIAEKKLNSTDLKWTDDITNRGRWWAKHILSPNFHLNYSKTVSTSEVVSDKSMDKQHPSFLELGLADKDVHVRAEAIAIAVAVVSSPYCAAALRSCGASANLMRTVLARICDKKAKISLHALDGLVRCFTSGLVDRFWVPKAEARLVRRDFEQSGQNSKRKAISKQANEEKSDSSDHKSIDSDDENLSDPEEDSIDPGEQHAEQLFAWIPGELFKHSARTGLPHSELLLYRLRLCEQFNQTILVRSGKKKNNLVRSFILSELWARLDILGKRAFTRLFFEQRTRLCELLTQFFVLHSQARENENAHNSEPIRLGNSKRDLPSQQSGISMGSNATTDVDSSLEVSKDEIIRKGHEVLRRIAYEFVPEQSFPKAVSLLTSLWDVKDKYILRDLQFLCAYDGEPSNVPTTKRNAMPKFDQVKEKMIDCLKRVGSRSDLADILRVLFSRLFLYVFYLEELSCLSKDIMQYYVSCGKSDRVIGLCSFVKTALGSFNLPSSAGMHGNTEIAKWMLDLSLAKLTSPNDKVSISKRLSLNATEALCTVGCTVFEKEHATHGAKRKENDFRSRNTGYLLETLKGLMLDCGNVRCAKAACKSWLSGLGVDISRKSKATKNISTEEFETAEAQVANEDIVSLLDRVVHNITSGRKDLACMFAIVAQFLKLVPSFFSTYSTKRFKKIMDFVRHTVKRPFKPGSTLAHQGVRKVYGVKVICYDALRKIREGRDSIEFNIESLKRNLLLLRKIIADHGDPWTGERNRSQKRDEKNSSGVENDPLNEDAGKDNIETSNNESKPSKSNETNSKMDSSLSTWPPSEEENFRNLRLAAARALVKIEAECLTSDLGSQVLSEGSSDHKEQRAIQRWVELSWIALDPCYIVRKSFSECVYKHIVRSGRELFRFGSFFVLASASDDACTETDVIDGLNLTVKSDSSSTKSMNQLLGFLHRKVESRSKAAHSDIANAQIAQLAPENMMANLIFLLAHHPSMPVQRQEAENFLMSTTGQRVIVKPIIALLDALSSLTQDRTTNAGLLYALLNEIRCSHDGLDQQSCNMHMVGEICHLLIKQRIKVSADSLSFPGMVVLPRFFVSPSENAQQNRRSSRQSSTSPHRILSTPDSRAKNSHVSPVVRRSSSSKRSSLATSSKKTNTPRTPTTEVSRPSAAFSPHESLLPTGFEIRIGGREPGNQTHGNANSTGRASVTPKPKKTKKRSITPNQSSGRKPLEMREANEPVRKQPKRRTRAQANVSYTEVNSDMED